MENTLQPQVKPSDIKAPIKTLRVDARVWDRLKDLKRENETFNEVILELLNERTKAKGNEDIKAILYKRKIDFLTINQFNQEIGIEFEYNDIKGNKSDFVLDVRIRKVFHERAVHNPSEFFGVDSSHKHYSGLYLMIYLLAVAQSLKKEFRLGHIFEYTDKDGTVYTTPCDNMVEWRKVYYYYNLSEESFKQDVEDPLRLSRQDKNTRKWQEMINDSVASKLEKDFISKQKLK